MSFFQFVFSKAFLKQLLYAILVLIVLTFLILWWLGGTTNHGQKIEVPDLSKLSLDKVEEVLEEEDLRYEIIDSANYNPDFPRYSVIDQIPKPGNAVKEDRKIYLYLNPSGYRKVALPEVVGRTLRQAEPTLLAMGFEVGKISYRPHISDQVLQMRYKGEAVEPGTELQKTSVIDLIVGDQSLNRVNDFEDEGEVDSENTETENTGGDGE